MRDTEPTQWEKIFQRDGHIFPQAHPLVMRFTELLIEHGLRTVLDLGCGTGRHVVYMAQKGLRVSGLDNAPTALKLTKQWLTREGLTTNLILSDMRQPLPFDDGSFDTVLSTQVIHHSILADVLSTAREIERIVRKDGLIMISVPTQKAISEDAPEHAEIEPNTFVPTSGTEMGLPHHLFMPDEFRDIFPRFQVMDLQVYNNRVLVLQAIKK
jgi:SAM-dependent methyltransferase